MNNFQIWVSVAFKRSGQVWGNAGGTGGGIIYPNPEYKMYGNIM